MWVSEMKLKFKLKVFLTVLAISAAFAGVAAWATGLNFWVLAAIAVAAVLVNGLIASIEDKDSARKQDKDSE
jgi:membrane protein implicated in regulation of membrane protease activity